MVKSFKELRKLIPDSLSAAIRNDYLVSIIQFGSSMRRKNYRDIDLAIVLRRGCYERFIKSVYGKRFDGFDVSLIKEEEVQGPKKFQFGGHGSHFLYSLIRGKVLYGINPFRRFKVTNSQIKESAVSRMYDYIEDVRRTIFCGKVKKSIKSRWPKFLRLSLYLLDSDLKYPQVLDMKNREVKKYLKRHKLTISTWPKNILVAYEIIWSMVLKKRKRISS